MQRCVKSSLKAYLTSHITPPHSHSQLTFPHHSTMSTPSSTFLPPHPSAAPVPAPITLEFDHLIPVVLLPPTIATAQNVPLSTTSSPTSIASTPDVRHSQPVNPVSALATDEQHFPLTAAFHTHLLTTERSPSPSRTTSECILVRNSPQDCAASAQLPNPSAYQSATRAQDLCILDSTSSDTGQ